MPIALFLNWLGALLKAALRGLNRKLVYVPRGNVWGNDLEADLATVVVTDTPFCLDVGANKGQTIRLLQSVFSAPQIEAFEPSNECFRELSSQNWGPLVTCHHFGVGSTQSTLRFTNYDDPALSSFLPLDPCPVNPFSNAVVTSLHDVGVITVDGFCEKLGVKKIDLLKIDTQGFDFEVLKGAEELLNANAIRCILVELNFISLYVNQGNACEIMEWLMSRGYKVVDFYEKKRMNNGIHWCTAMFVSDPTVQIDANS